MDLLNKSEGNSYSSRNLGMLDKELETRELSTRRTSSQPSTKHFSSPRVISYTISISHVPHNDPTLEWGHEQMTALETNNERYRRLFEGISSPHLTHHAACSGSNSAEKALFTLQQTRQSAKSSTEISVPGILVTLLGNWEAGVIED